MQIGEELIEKEILIESCSNGVLEVESFIDEFRQNNKIDDEIFGNILVAVTEAVNNAIIHGNKMDKSKSVRLVIRKRRNVVTCNIKDEGNGFDYNNLPDPTAPENIECLGGRGVFLMKHLADLVVFSSDGSNVEIQFRV
ncbi:MAG: ATP-binding protein [Bacteroidetes bacterium]|nr:ATP-binding protein [Bacteroidota bacterium]MBP7399046.1 ATP-binding protein [Chitinophagales bacterium]MBK8486301.1 ATP-binding protein [Bacteroidota bacterium]MBK8683083.1 ATP-binding protein [Bacteroidota bacterium]MBP8753067.1 ATP-binding protein [Chitinophagales bacterium]